MLTEKQAVALRCCGSEGCGMSESIGALIMESRCIASACMAWRWQPLMTSQEWIDAVKKAASDLDDKSPGRIKAVAHINANRSAYGLPDKPFRGWCGLAGKPE